jgi:hypothetical protein
MQFIIKRLEIELATPEYVFMVQDDEIQYSTNDGEK